MSVTYSIKVSGESLSAKALMETKKLTGKPLADIKSAVTVGAPIFECDCADEEGMETMLALRSALEAEGAKPTHLVNGRVEPFSHLVNALNSYRSIDEVDGEEY